MLDPKLRFSNRVENYRKYRPAYPAAVLRLLESECGLTSSSVVADVGSGTGILSELFLENGNRVYGVEPNAEMRAAAERSLGRYAGFTSVNGCAEGSTLPEASVDLVTAAQAFHWFDPPRARVEFGRILRPHGWVALMWNDRRLDSTPFLAAYDAMLRIYGPEYEGIRRKQIDEDAVRALYGGDHFASRLLEHVQHLDFDSLRGRLLSASYVPDVGSPGHTSMLEDLKRIFAAHDVNGVVSLEYDTRIYYGHL